MNMIIISQFRILGSVLADNSRGRHTGTKESEVQETTKNCGCFGPTVNSNRVSEMFEGYSKHLRLCARNRGLCP